MEPFEKRKKRMDLALKLDTTVTPTKPGKEKKNIRIEVA